MGKVLSEAGLGRTGDDGVFDTLERSTIDAIVVSKLAFFLLDDILQRTGSHWCVACEAIHDASLNSNVAILSAW